MCGAETWIGATDAPYANGSVDLTWAKELCEIYYESFQPDHLINDGDIFKLGNVEIEMLNTPGHTSGTISFFFDIPHEGKMLTVGMHGGVGTNSMSKSFLDEYNLDYSCRQYFFDSLERLKQKHVDVFLGNHTWNNDTLGKSERMTKESNPFIDASAWPVFLDNCKQALEKTISEEQQ